MSRALYRKYRSKTLDEVVGQSHITDILSRSLKEGRLSHAYLFTGPRGVGKTSIARILAHEINELPYTEASQYLDIIEIDAASNNGVEDIRELRERVSLAPVHAKKKVYIIDEVHMLSKAAFNALLKTLEEPPAHIVFILATTDADKLPETIISRTQRFNFRTITVAEVARHLKWIAEQEGFKADPEALELIAVHGEGSFRDSIGLLDQLQSAADDNKITKASVEFFLGLPPQELIHNLLDSHRKNDLKKIVLLLNEAEDQGVQPSIAAAELIRAIRNNLPEQPELIPLLDALLEVSKSSRPEIKLLTVLASGAAAVTLSRHPEKKNIALKAAVLSSTRESAGETSLHQNLPDAVKNSTPKTESKQAPFDWTKAVSHIQKSDLALHTVLSKCTPYMNNDILTIYTGNVFYKKKLDSTRYRTTLIEALTSAGMGGYTIDTVGTAPPPANSIAASVAALMGGGEEYSMAESESGTP